MLNSIFKSKKLFLTGICCLFILILSCGGGGSGGSGSAPDIISVEFTGDAGGIDDNILIFDLGSKVNFYIEASDLDKNMKKLVINTYFPSDSQTPYESDTIELPSQQATEMEYSLSEEATIAGNLGEYRMEFFIEDSNGNRSSIYTTYYNIARKLDFNISDAKYETVNKYIHLSSKENKTLYSIDTITGQTENEITFSYMPETISITPDQTKIFVALLTREHDWYWFDEDQEGFIAEVDTNTLEKVDELSIPIDPFDIVAVDKKQLFISGGSGQSSYIYGYDLNTMETIQSCSSYMQKNIALYPSQNSLYTSTKKILPIINNWENWDAYYTNSATLYEFGKFFIAPSGNFLVTEHGEVIQCKINTGINLEDPLELSDTDISAASFDPTYGYIYTIEENHLNYYDMDTFEIIGQIQIPVSDNYHLYVSEESSSIILITSSSSYSRILILPAPEMDENRHNAPPDVSLVSDEDYKSTIDAFEFNALANDDNTGEESFKYQWDWESDGIFDTEFSDQKITYHSFNEPGTYLVTVKIVDKWGLSSTASCTVSVVGEIHIPFEIGGIADIYATDDPEYIYALDYNEPYIYLINTLSRQIVNKYETASDKSIAFSFSTLDNTFYILDSDEENLCVFNRTTLESQLITLSEIYALYDIEIDSTRRRIYISCSVNNVNSVLIYDMDTLLLISENPTTGIPFVNINRNEVYTRNSVYNISGDSLVLADELTDNRFYLLFDLSPDCSKLAASSRIDDSVVAVVANVDTIESNLASFNSIYRPEYMKFSEDSAKIFTIKRTDFNIIDTEDFSLINFRLPIGYDSFSDDYDDYLVATNIDSSSVFYSGRYGTTNGYKYVLLYLENNEWKRMYL